MRRRSSQAGPCTGQGARMVPGYVWHFGTWVPGYMGTLLLACNTPPERSS